MREKLSLAQSMGLKPWRKRLAQALIALRGEEHVPSTKFGLSSLAQLRPRIGIPLWMGRPYRPRTLFITNLFNHRQTPIEDGWSVKKIQVEDFRGRRLTYDSHNGTDFALPLGSRVVAPADGVVVRVVSEFNRGGLKIFIDHGEGLMTTCAHLAKALVSEGQLVRRGESIAVSGYSGLDALITFPLGVPHVHFNVWLNGFPIDPFSRGDEASIWRGGHPQTCQPGEEQKFERSEYDSDRVEALIASCLTDSSRDELRAIKDPQSRADHAVSIKNYYPTRFDQSIMPYAELHPRRELLDAPFLQADFDRVLFVDDEG
jgi:murein DD-endopeptidase